MNRTTTGILTCLLLLCLAAPVAAQSLDGRPYDPERDPDIDMFIGNWRDSMPRQLHGNLVVRDILTRLVGEDPLHPARKGAVLEYTNSISHATLAPRSMTVPDKLDGVQEAIYVVSGIGTITSGRNKTDIGPGSGILIPPGVEFTMANTGVEPLTMYMLNEPIPDGFTPRETMLVRNKFDGPAGLNVHWSNIDRSIVGGLANYGGLTSVTIDAMTIAQPHSHGTGVEEIWIAVEGDILLQFGKELRTLPIGSAYKIPDNGITAHANINAGNTPINLIHMMKSLRAETPKYAALEPSKFDPNDDPPAGLFIGNRLHSMPRILHGALIVRDMLTPLAGDDPLRPTLKGAVLTKMQSVSGFTLEANGRTQPATLDSEQYIFYIDGGCGTIRSGNESFDLREGIGILVPPSLEFTMEAGATPITGYLVVEPVPAGFTPNSAIKVVDEHEGPLNISVHWANIDNGLFSKGDGLTTLLGIGVIRLDAMTIAQPHSHAEGIEEVWFAIDGDIMMLLGKQLRRLPVGAAYKIPADNMTAHANINRTDDVIKLMWIMHVPGQ